MINRRVSLVFIVLLTIALLGGCARHSQTVSNIDDGRVPAGMSMASVQKSILEGCSMRGWTCKETGDGMMRGSIWVRGKHYAEVDIRYSDTTLMIRYADSTNLEYNPERNTIHQNYNTWVDNLYGDIMNALLRNSP